MTERPEQERSQLDLNNTDFHVWDYGLLVSYHRELVKIIASLKSQIDRNNMRLEYFHDCREETNVNMDFEKVYDERWRKGVVYSLHLAELALAEVTRRMDAVERGKGRP